jgi:RNA polymerase sigma-70 factor (ECF subfamily)
MTNLAPHPELEGVVQVLRADPEAEAVAAARGGDQQALRGLVERHSRTVFQLCWRVTRDAALAEDAAQEAFYKVWRGLAEFDGRCAFATWLHRIAVNAALETMRRQSRHASARVEPRVDEDDQAFDPLELRACLAPDPLQRAEGAELRGRIHEAMTQMSALERAAFVMKHLQGASLAEICEQLELNLGQCKQAVFRAVRKLRAALPEWE